MVHQLHRRLDRADHHQRDDHQLHRPGIDHPEGITAGPDGALWFTNIGGSTIGRITTGGTVTNYADPRLYDPWAITAGPDGALWFTNRSNNSIGRITTSGTITTYTDPGVSSPHGITAGPDGALWFTNADGNSIGRITTSGTVTTYGRLASATTIAAVPNPSSYGQPVTFTATVSPTDGGGTVAFGADGNPIPGCSSLPLSLVSGSSYQATCTTSALAVGSHVIEASYSGDPHYSDSLATITQTVNERVTVQDSSLLITYGYWQGVTDTAASGGTYRQNAYATGHAQFTFSGTAVKWVTIKGPDKGIASVTINGVSKGKFDLYRATKTPSVLTFSGLSATSHTIKIVVTGAKNSASSGYNVPIDAFIVGTTTTQDTSRKITYGWWAGKTSTSASGGTYRSAASAGPASFTFTGTRVDWITTTGPSYGKAEVYLDGVDQGTVDLYSPTTHWQTAKSYIAAGPGQHTLTVQVLAQKNAASTGKAVNLDAFTV